MILKYNIVEHKFGTGETVRAVIHKINNHCVDSDTIDYLISEFNRINHSHVPRLGDTFKIPKLDQV